MLKKHTHNKAILRGPFVSGKILIIDRDIENTKSLIDCFEEEHFTVKLVDNSQQAMNHVLSYQPEIILLDIEFPDTSGLDIFRAILLDKQTESIPTIILTAKAEPIDRVVGLELGAEDYIAKPFDTREVILRTKGVLRRRRKRDQPSDQRIKLHGIEIDIGKREVNFANSNISLTNPEFELLVYLAKSPGRVFSRNDLMYRLWGYRPAYQSRSIDSHLSRLKKKLGRIGQCIQTVRGVGYRFQPDLS